jgi:CheY-like chemotaxis protein
VSLIAVVDNDAHVLGLLTDLLENQGWTVTTYRSGEEAITFLRKEQPDLVLLDLWLEAPASGWHVLRDLRSEPQTHDIPVVLLFEAGDGVPTNDAWLRELGVAVVPKPFDVDVLCHSLETVLQGSGSGVRST